jgi:hypothetical protein
MAWHRASSCRSRQRIAEKNITSPLNSAGFLVVSARQFDAMSAAFAVS